MSKRVFLLFFFVSRIALGQDMRYIDSLLKVINETNLDSVKAGNYSEIAYVYRKQDNAKSLEYAKTALDLARKCSKPKIEWSALNSMGEANRLMGNLETALKIHQEALNLALKNKFRVKRGHSLNNIAIVYKLMGNVEKCKEHYLNSLAAYIEAQYEDGFYTVYNNLGNLYHKLKKNDSALYNYIMAYKYIGPTSDSTYHAQNYNNRSLAYWYLGYNDSALMYSEKAVALYRKFGTKGDLANAGSGLGEMYTEFGKYDKAKVLLEEMIEVARASGDKNELSDAQYYYARNLFATKQYKLAYLYKDSAQALYDQILSEEKLKAINEAAEKYESEKKQLMINQLNTENTAKQNLLDEAKKTRLFMAIGLILVVLFSVYLFYTVKQRDKTNRIINEQKKEVELQKILIETHQKETLDSINYAKRIQYSLLAHDELLKANLKEYFVLFKPKDIVSGDFYWATYSGNKFYLAVCDSTGHGVPGAFMSLLNINFMNEAINEKRIQLPNAVFDHVRKGLIRDISQEGQRDGMDGILMCFDNGKITYSSANNAPVLVSEGEIQEFPKDKMPVGAGEKDVPFNLYELNAKKGDVVYLYTDGFADQFGGDKGKKFKYKQLNELLLSICQLPMDQQKQKLESTFNKWKGNLEQVDDVCVIGIRL